MVEAMVGTCGGGGEKRAKMQLTRQWVRRARCSFPVWKGVCCARSMLRRVDVCVCVSYRAVLMVGLRMSVERERKDGEGQAFQLIRGAKGGGGVVDDSIARPFPSPWPPLCSSAPRRRIHNNQTSIPV